MTDRPVNARTFARILGMRPSYVTALREAGRLVLDDDGGILVDASRERIRATADPAKDGVRARHARTRATSEGAGRCEPPAAPVPPPAAPDADCDADPSHAQRRAKALADKAETDALAAKRDLALSLAELLPAGEVIAAVRAAGTTLRHALENMPNVLAPQLAGESDEGRVRVLLAEAVEHALEEITRQFSAMAQEPAP